MASIGNSPTQQAFTPAIDYFSGTGSATAFTLSRPVASVAQVQVTIDNVAQNPSSAYTVSGSTITFTSAPLSGTNNIYVYYTSPITQVIAPGQGTVTATSMASSTGTGAGVFQTSPTITTPVISSLSSASATALTLQSAGTTAITIDTAQNVGLKTTPSAWNTFTSSLQIDGASLSGLGANNTALASNAYYNSAWKYYGTGSASLYQQNAGQHAWSIAGSGTAGNAITFTQAMTLDASGNLGIGETSPTQKIHLKGSSTTYGLAETTGTGTSSGFRMKAGASADYTLFTSQGVNQFAIYDNAAGIQRVTLDSSGNLLVGKTSVGSTNTGFEVTPASGVPVIRLTSSGTVPQSKIIFYNNSGTYCGEIYTGSGTSTTYANASDYRLKEDVQAMQGALSKVMSLKPVTYKWKSDGSFGEGFIAHELQEVVPLAVSRHKDSVDADGNPEYQGVDQSKLVATLTAAIQELKAINDTQAATITALTARIVALENR